MTFQSDQSPASPAQPPYAAERAVAEQLAREAGALLLHYRRTGFSVEEKTSSDDLVTVADREASALITAGLRAAFPGDGLLSEEETDSGVRLSRRRVWIIDPIDGTKEFVDGSAQYCVSIGLAVDGEAVLGVVMAPEHDELFTGIVAGEGMAGEHQGGGVWKNGERAGFSVRPPEGCVIAVSDTEYTRELHRYALPEMVPSGSIALKMARIAAGEADATFTMSPRSEWDIAAGMALIAAAGGTTTRRDGSPIQLNQKETYLRRGILAGRPDVLAWLTRRLHDLAMPEQHLDLRPGDAVWPLLPDEARALDGQQHLFARVAAGQLTAWAAASREAGVTRIEGGPLDTDVLRKDILRGLDALG